MKGSKLLKGPCCVVRSRSSNAHVEPVGSKIMHQLFHLILAALLISTSAMALDTAAVQVMENGFAADFNRGDSEALAKRYTEDAYVLPLNSEMVRGRGAIASFFEKAIQTRTDLKMTALDVQPLGSDAAMVIGTVALKIRAQPAQQEDRKYLKIYRRVGDDWKMSAFIWNGNKAP